jgi:hypothetical protein
MFNPDTAAHSPLRAAMGKHANLVEYRDRLMREYFTQFSNPSAESAL